MLLIRWCRRSGRTGESQDLKFGLFPCVRVGLHALGLAVHGLPEHKKLLLDEGPDDVVDRVLGEEVVHLHRPVLANSVDAVLGLEQQPWRPVQLSEHNEVCRVERDPSACSGDAQDGNPVAPLCLEGVYVLLALLGRRRAVYPDVICALR